MPGLRSIRLNALNNSSPSILITSFTTDASRSANGAKYDSQGQARSASPLDRIENVLKALKGRNNIPREIKMTG
jgi:hypothetical protein